MQSLALVISLALCAACSSLNAPFTRPKPTDVSKVGDVPAAIETARADFDAGRTADALARVRSAREVAGLDADTRNQLDVLIEKFAERRIQELSKPGSDPHELADVFELGLPLTLAVEAGVGAARLLLDQGHPYKAYSQLKKVETKYPRHPGKVEAGEILFKAGMQLADDPWNFMGFFATRDDGIEVLEFLVLTYPLEKHCDEAFFKLATMYEHDRLWELARQRHEELLYSHIRSPLAVQSEARIPHLRLAGLDSPEYDRKELLKARDELKVWLEHHPDHELAPQVQVDYADCLQRLVASDMGIAAFYRRISEPFGARFHAARALETAKLTNDGTLIASAQDLLSSLPEVSSLPGASPPRGDESFSTDPSLIRSLQERAREKADAQPAKPTDAPPVKPAGGTPP
jgi:outer membrane protein assembly factor BamD (BamD/ComL family)